MAFRPAGADEDDFDEDGFYIGGDDDIVNEFSDNISSSKFKSATTYSTQAKTDSYKPQQNGFGRRLPPRNGSQHVHASGMLLDKFRTAAMRGHIEVIDECLTNGIGVDQLLRCGWTALMYAASSSSTSLINFLLDHGADPNFHKDLYTVLMAACSSKSEEKLVLECVEMLITKKAVINSEDRYHISPLIYAAREGHTSVVEKLIDSDAVINKQDSRGYTALSWATDRKRRGVIKVLLQHGADPSIRQADGLMARDLALGNDEIISMLDGNKNSSNSLPSVDMASEPAVKPVPVNEVDHTENSFKQFDSRHGEVEVFLYGLDLGELVPLFQDQHINFETFLRMTEQDLINMKITQLGWRKKILDGIQAVHKKDWEATSLISSQYSKHIGCADAIAMVANLSKQVRYIGSTIGYIYDQIQVHPEILLEIKDGTGPIQLQRHTEDAVRNVAALTKEVERLQRRLNRELKGRDLNPPDEIAQTKKSKSLWSKITLTFLSLTVVGIATVVWKRDVLSEKVMYLKLNT